MPNPAEDIRATNSRRFLEGALDRAGDINRRHRHIEQPQTGNIALVTS
jgi:hypothetical protein